MTVSTLPDILKYFHEEPALLEPVTPDADPDARRREDRSDLPDNVSVPLSDLLDTRDAYRGYLAGTNQADDRIGLTALRDADAFVTPIVEALGQAWWGQCTTDADTAALEADEAREILANPGDTAVLVTASNPVDAERMTALIGRARRRALSTLRALLDVAHVAFFSEPAHDGHDWSFFAAAPMRDRLVAALRNHPTDRVRRFVLPYQRARSESKFYFDRWQLTESPLPEYVEEV